MCIFVAEYRKAMRFIGNIEARVDAKGRAFFPSTFRKVLQASGQDLLVLRKDIFLDCLVLYPESVWNEQLDTLRARLNRYNPKHQLIFRQFVSEVEMIRLDGNNRFLIPKRYQQLADIRQDIRFIGMDDTIEIWASEKVDGWKMASEDFGKALDEVMGSGGGFAEAESH